VAAGVAVLDSIVQERLTDSEAHPNAQGHKLPDSKLSFLLRHGAMLQMKWQGDPGGPTPLVQV